MTPEEKRERQRAAGRRWGSRHREYRRQWQLKHKESARIAARKWLQNPENRDAKRAYQQAHREDRRAAERARVAKDREKFREKSRKWHAENPDKVKEVTRKHYAKYVEVILQKNRDDYRKDPENARETLRRRRRSNPERTQRQQYKDTAKRRAILLNAEGSHTAEDVARLYESQSGTCAACGLVFSKTGKRRYHVDHIIPLKPRRGERKGTDWPDNLQLLCQSCNDSKGNMQPEAWAKRRAAK